MTFLWLCAYVFLTLIFAGLVILVHWGGLWVITQIANCIVHQKLSAAIWAVLMTIWLVIVVAGAVFIGANLIAQS